MSGDSLEVVAVNVHVVVIVVVVVILLLVVVVVGKICFFFLGILYACKMQHNKEGLYNG